MPTLPRQGQVCGPAIALSESTAAIDGISDVTPFVQGGGHPITVDIERGGKLVRVRASPPNGGWHSGALGITGTQYFFGHGEPSDPGPNPADTYIPPPIIPDPPPSLPPSLSTVGQ